MSSFVRQNWTFFLFIITIIPIFVTSKNQIMTNQEIHNICNEYNITNYTINRDGSIDVDGDVNLSYMELTEIPLKFNKVRGCFYCYGNKLTSLEGSPERVGGNFSCYNNQLTSLIGSPKEVGGYFSCSNNNQLTSLEGSPKEVGGGFYCHNNQLTTLEGCPEIVGDSFDCDNKQ